jgi:protein-disulfide reductase (glutathione)
VKHVRNGYASLRIAVGAVVMLSLVLGRSLVVHAGIEDWNDAKVKWMSYADGLAAAKKEHKPICLIFFTTWCPHCKNYSNVFSNDDVVKKSQSFVMIHLDKDQNVELSAKYKPDGEYIPRTYFLSSDGQLDESVTAGREQFKYFYDESNPASILAGMDRALKKLK